MCELHKHHWRWRALCLRTAALAVCFLPWVAMLLCFLEMDVSIFGQRDLLTRHPFDIGFIVLILMVLITSLIALLVLCLTGIRAVGLGRWTLTLTGIAPEFTEAIRVLRGNMLPEPGGATADELAHAITVKPRVRTFDSISSLVVENLVEWARQEGALAADTLRVLRAAQLAPNSFGHDYLGTEHLLLALRTTIPSEAAYLLKSSGVETIHLEEAIRTLSGTTVKTNAIVGWASPAGMIISQPPVTPRLSGVISDAFEHAHTNGHSVLETTDLLVALLRDQDTIAAEILRSLGLDDCVHKAITMAEKAPQPDTRIKSER